MQRSNFASCLLKDLGTLTYFAGIKSRGEPTQMIAKYGGVQMKVNLISFEEWGKLKSDKIPFMPFITQSDGTIMLETENICKHLATMGGKFVVDSKQEELCKIANSPPMQLADPLYNLPDGGASLGVPPLAKWLEAVTPVLKDLVGKLGDGPFFAGEAPGYGEAFIFHNLDNQFALAKHELTTAIGKEAMAKLEAFYARFAALDGIEEYLAERPKVWGVPGSKGNPVGGSKVCSKGPREEDSFDLHVCERGTSKGYQMWKGGANWAAHVAHFISYGNNEPWNQEPQVRPDTRRNGTQFQVLFNAP